MVQPFLIPPICCNDGAAPCRGVTVDTGDREIALGRRIAVDLRAMLPAPLGVALLCRPGIGERGHERRVDRYAAGRNPQVGDTAQTVGPVGVSAGEQPGAEPLRIPIPQQPLGAGLGERVLVAGTGTIENSSSSCW